MNKLGQALLFVYKIEYKFYNSLKKLRKEKNVMDIKEINKEVIREAIFS